MDDINQIAIDNLNAIGELYDEYSTNYKRLKANLEYLKMNQMINHLDDVIDYSIKNNLSFIDTLIKLSDYEIEIKRKNLIESMVVAAFPFKKKYQTLTLIFNRASINKKFGILQICVL